MTRRRKLRCRDLVRGDGAQSVLGGHGTAHSAPQSSPLTVALGWNYYRNLTRRDFESTMDLGKAFVAPRFWTNWNHFDLLFLGTKQGAGVQEEVRWRNAAAKIDAWIDRCSSSRVHAYRALAAKTLGDPWFRTMHGAMSALSWLHNPR
jgi:hypothetical protein